MFRLMKTARADILYIENAMTLCCVANDSNFVVLNLHVLDNLKYRLLMDH